MATGVKLIDQSLLPSGTDLGISRGGRGAELKKK